MRQKILGFILIIVMLQGMATAQHKIGITVGGQYWLTMLDYDLDFYDEGRVQVEASHIYGPTLHLRFGMLHIAGSYTMGTFNFDAIGKFDLLLDKYESDHDQYYDMIMDAYAGADHDTYYAVRFQDYATTFDRNEINASIGYMLSSNLLLFGAYKGIRYTWKETDMNYVLYEYIPHDDPFQAGDYTPVINGDEDDSRFTSPYSRTQNLHYFGPGLMLSLPFGTIPVSLDTRAVYYFPSDQVNSEITAITALFTYRAPFGLNASIGYHAQLRSLPDKRDYEKTTHGPVVQLSYTLGLLKD